MFPELTDPKMDRLSHISFETTDAEQMRAYLASRGVKVPEKLEPMQDGNRGFDVIDPDGHDVEFVEFRPGSLHTRNFGKFSSRHAHFDAHHPCGGGGEGPRGRGPLLQGYSGVQIAMAGWHERKGFGLGGHARARRNGLGGIHAEREQSGSPSTWSDAPFLIGRAQYPGRISAGGQTRI